MGKHVLKQFTDYAPYSLLENRSVQEALGAAKLGWYYPKHRAEATESALAKDWPGVMANMDFVSAEDYFPHISTDDAFPRLGWIDQNGVAA